MRVGRKATTLYIVSSHVLAQLERAGCFCGGLALGERCEHCRIVEGVRDRYRKAYGIRKPGGREEVGRT